MEVIEEEISLQRHQLTQARTMLLKLRQAQLKDVSEMQRIYAAAAEIGANAACSKVVGGSFSLSDEVRRGVEAHAASNHR